MRTQLYPEYKQKSFKSEEDQQEAEHYREVYHYQRDLLLQWLPYFGVHVVNGPYESDDSIWYLTTALAQYNIHSVVVSEDHDFCQLLISDHVQVYAPHKEVMVNQDTWALWTKWAPDQIVMAKAILGDSSDNIPSPCAGLGPTGLKKLFLACQKFTLDEIVDVAGKKFHKHKKYASLQEPATQQIIQRNYQLISFTAGFTFTSDYEREYVWKEVCSTLQHNSHAVMQFLAQYEMANLLRIYGMWMPAFQGLA